MVTWPVDVLVPTDDRNLAEVLCALLAVGNVTLEEVPVMQMRGYRLTVNASIVIDGEHEQSIQKVLDP